MNDRLYDPKKVFRAGTIPYILEDDEIQMMFMKPSDPLYGGPDWQIAKGKIEEGETAKEAALREAREEIGLFVGNVSLIEEVGCFMGRTTVFVAKVDNKDMFGMFGEETGDVSWLTMDQFMSEGRLLHQPTVQAAYRMICKLEGISD